MFGAGNRAVDTASARYCKRHKPHVVLRLPPHIRSPQPVHVHRRPLFRDVIAYIISVSCLLGIVLTNAIFRWQAVVLIVLYVVYVIGKWLIALGVSRSLSPRRAPTRTPHVLVLMLLNALSATSFPWIRSPLSPSLPRRAPPTPISSVLPSLAPPSLSSFCLVLHCLLPAPPCSFLPLSLVFSK